MIPRFPPGQLEVGPLMIDRFAVATLLAVCVWLFVAMWKARSREVPVGAAVGVVVAMLVGGMVTGHVLYALMYQPDYVAENPAFLLNIWAGVSGIGFVVGAVPIAVVILAIAARDRLGDALDVLAVGLIAGWVVYRLGCFSVHDHPGAETTFFLGVRGICPAGDPVKACHDLGLYESLLSLMAAVPLLALPKRLLRPGALAGIVVVAFSSIWVIVDVFRDGAPLLTCRTPLLAGVGGVIIALSYWRPWASRA